MESRRRVVFHFDGAPIEAFEGEPIAAALLASGIRVLRTSERMGRPRGIFCNIGHCFECRVVVAGERDVRACITPVDDALDVRSQHSEDGAS